MTRNVQTFTRALTILKFQKKLKNKEGTLFLSLENGQMKIMIYLIEIENHLKHAVV
jgi:hypothetical protein